MRDELGLEKRQKVFFCFFGRVSAGVLDFRHKPYKMNC